MYLKYLRYTLHRNPEKYVASFENTLFEFRKIHTSKHQIYCPKYQILNTHSQLCTKCPQFNINLNKSPLQFIVGF